MTARIMHFRPNLAHESHRRPRTPPAVLGSAAGRAQVSEECREGAKRRCEEREKMLGREEGISWERGKKKLTRGSHSL